MKRKLNIRPNTVAILTTNQCTAKCDICCFNCSPTKKEKMPLDLQRKIIVEAAKLPNIDTVGFSGGEPFLVFDEIIEMSSLAKKYGLRVICTSNGFWGTSEARALELLSKFKANGLVKLSLSCDLHHAQYVDVKKIKNILKACYKINLPVDIGSVITKSTADLSTVFSELKEEMINVPHYTAACLPVGSAEKEISENEYFHDPYIFERCNVCYETTYYAVFPNGDVYPCCSQAGATPPLKLGNVNEISMKEVEQNYNANIHIRIMKKYGINWYLEKANNLEYNTFFEKEFVNKCHLCREIFSDAKFMTLVIPYLEEEKRKIYEKYLECLREKSAV